MDSGLRQRGRRRGREVLRAWVERSDDARLERTVGSPAGLRVLFLAMQATYVPEAGGGTTGEVACELRGSDGEVRRWALVLETGRARARPRAARAPLLTVRVSTADFVRMAAGALDPGTALLTRRLDLLGDGALAARLGAMFGRPGL